MIAVNSAKSITPPKFFEYQPECVNRIFLHPKMIVRIPIFGDIKAH